MEVVGGGKYWIFKDKKSYVAEDFRESKDDGRINRRRDRRIQYHLRDANWEIKLSRKIME